MVSTATKIGAFDFDNCFMNAAGVYCMTREELAEIDASAAGSFVTKTGTLTARAGNPEPRYADTSLGSINSMGLPKTVFNIILTTLQSSKIHQIANIISYHLLACQKKKHTPFLKPSKILTTKDWWN